MYICFVCVCSCVHLELDDENVCSPYLSHMIFNYANASYYKTIANTVDQLKALLELATDNCRVNGLLLGCSILFVPCNPTSGAPIPLCSNDCFSYESKCYSTFSVFIDIAEFNNFPFIHNCENTLSHLSVYYNYQNSSSDFEDNCLALPGIVCYHVIVINYVCMYIKILNNNTSDTIMCEANLKSSIPEV